ncbi:MAG: DUF6457 domain-containing protein [Actinomycetota bacterium]|nr:DUF6457 domain-containing protein [Actinomycetota bacterium]
MTDWIDRLADGMGVQAVSAAEADRLLRASREVAHRVERRITPLATFVLGLAVATRTSQGASRETAFDEALDSLLRRLPEAPPSTDDAQMDPDSPPNAGRE